MAGSNSGGMARGVAWLVREVGEVVTRWRRSSGVTVSVVVVVAGAVVVDVGWVCCVVAVVGTSECLVVVEWLLVGCRSKASVVMVRASVYRGI